MVERYWLGIDAGTTAIKAAVYRGDGTRVALGEVPSEVKVAPGGRSEQDMEDVWRGVCAAVRAALSGIDAAAIESVGVAAQGDGLWALDADFAAGRSGDSVERHPRFRFCFGTLRVEQGQGLSAMPATRRSGPAPPGRSMPG